MKFGSMEKYLMSLFSSTDEELSMANLIDKQLIIYRDNYGRRHNIDQVTKIPSEFLCRMGCFKRVMTMKEKGFLEQVLDEPKIFRIQDIERWKQAIYEVNLTDEYDK
jgi:hypothetical protein